MTRTQQATGNNDDDGNIGHALRGSVTGDLGRLFSHLLAFVLKGLGLLLKNFGSTRGPGATEEPSLRWVSIIPRLAR
jgi:hypothetical protein